MRIDSDPNPDQVRSIPPTVGLLADGREEDSGIHDIKALARTAKRRVSARITTQNDAVSDVLSASHSGLHAVALPDPAKMVSLPSVEEARAMARSTGTFAGADDLAVARSAGALSTAAEPRSSGKGGVPAWMWAGGGIAAAAAAVLAFASFGGTKKSAEPTATSSERVPAAAGSAAATAKAEPAPAVTRDEVSASGVVDPADRQALDGAGATAPAVAAVDSGESEGTAGADGKTARPTGAGRGDGGKDDEASAKKSSGGDSKAAGGGKGEKIKADKTVDKADKTAPTEEPKKKGDGSVLGAGDSDELGIGDALTGGGGKVDKPSKTELTSKELREGLGAVAGKAKACFGSHGVAGTVKVKLTVDPGGKVSKASATGEFAGTPTGDCVSSALKAASFPAWDGAPMSTTYAVLLSD